MVIEFFVVLKILFIIAIDLKSFGYPCCLPREHSYFVVPLFEAVTICFSHFFTPTHKFLATEGNRVGFYANVQTSQWDLTEEQQNRSSCGLQRLDFFGGDIILF